MLVLASDNDIVSEALEITPNSDKTKSVNVAIIIMTVMPMTNRDKPPQYDLDWALPDGKVISWPAKGDQGERGTAPLLQ